MLVFFQWYMLQISSPTLWLFSMVLCKKSFFLNSQSVFPCILKEKVLLCYCLKAFLCFVLFSSLNLRLTWKQFLYMVWGVCWGLVVQGWVKFLKCICPIFPATVILKGCLSPLLCSAQCLFVIHVSRIDLLGLFFWALFCIIGLFICLCISTTLF